jgi:hypothetical protein
VYFTVGTDGEKLFYAKSGIEGESTLSQTITLPAGSYRVSAKVNTEEGSNVIFTCGDASVTVAGSDLGQHYFADAVIEKITLDEDSELTLSFRTTDGQWLRADDVRLYSLTKKTENIETLKGDANGDGTVSVEDITVVAGYILDPTTEIDATAADANGDGEITVTDITAIANIILGTEE